MGRSTRPFACPTFVYGPVTNSSMIREVFKHRVHISFPNGKVIKRSKSTIACPTFMYDLVSNSIMIHEVFRQCRFGGGAEVLMRTTFRSSKARRSIPPYRHLGGLSSHPFWHSISAASSTRHVVAETRRHARPIHHGSAKRNTIAGLRNPSPFLGG